MSNTNSVIASSLRAMGVTLISLADQLDRGSEEAPIPKKRNSKISSNWLFHHHRGAILAMAKREFEHRTRRSRFIDSKLLGEPVWDILLYLLPRKEAGVVSFATQVCSASGVPPTTGLRYISLLVERGILTESVCPFDARRTEIHLTDIGRSFVVDCLLDRLDRFDLPKTDQNQPPLHSVVIPLHRAEEPHVEEN